MAKTKIEWATHSINPVRGLCPMDCKDTQGKPYCYARKMYRRFKWNPEIYYNPTEMLKVATCPPGSRIFVGSTMELFGNWITAKERNHIIEFCRRMHDKTFIFLTKLPQNLPKEWPDNCWVGVSAVDYRMLSFGLEYLQSVKAKVKFLSIEPMLDRMNISLMGFVLKNCGTNWVIIGSRTQPVKHPPREWVEEIITACDIAGIPVFIKEPMASFCNLHRQEFPKYYL